MRPRALVLGILLLTTAGAGCLGADDAERSDGGATDERVPAPTGPPLPTYFLTSGMGLTEAQPRDGEPDRVSTGSFYADWTAGDEQPTWTGEPTPVAYHVTEVRLVFYYSAENAVVTTGPQDQGFPEFVVYFGTEAAPMGWASLEGPDVVRSEDIVEIRGELDLPAGGLVLPAGVEPVVKIAPVQAQGEGANQLEILVNSTSTPSRASLEGEPIGLATAQQDGVLDETGLLAGSAYATGPQEQTTADTYEVDVPAGTLGLIARLERTQGAGVADIDLEVLGPDGEVVARSVTPEDDEGVALYAPNVRAIGTGSWSLRVVNYGNVAVQYELTASVLEPVTSA